MEQEKVIKLEAELKDFYRNFHAQCDKVDTYYNLEFEIPNVEGFSAHHPSTSQVAIDDAAAQIDITSIRHSVPPRSPSRKHNAILQEQFLTGCWYGVLRNDGTLLNRTSKSMFQYGVAFKKILCDTDIEPADKENGYRFDQFPFLVLLKHPTHVMIDPSYFSTGTFRYVIESYKRKAGDILDHYPQWESGKSINDDVDWIEYWDKTSFLKIADGKTVDSGEHDYESPPYEVIDAGLGYHDKDGKPECRWRSLIHACFNDLSLEAAFLYTCHAILRMSAFKKRTYRIVDPTLITEAQVREWAATLSPHPLVPDIIPPGVEVIDPPDITIPPQIFQILSLIMGKIDTATVAKVARGERPEGTGSGYMLAILSGQARIKFGPAMNSLARSIERINRRFFRSAEIYYPEGLAVWGSIDAKPFDIKVTAKDIDHYYINEVTISSIAPEEEARKIDIGLRLFQANAISCYTLLKNFVGIEDPSSEETQKLIESVLNNPQIQDIMAQIIQTHPEFRQQIEAVVGETVAPSNPLGNQGNPPSPMQSGPTPETTMQSVPLQAGSPEEMNLVARQAQRGNVGNRLSPKPSMYNMTQ